MINLLPEKEKEEILFEKNKKLTIILGNVTLIALVSLVLVLFSLKFYILEKLVAQQALLDTIKKEYKDPDFLSFRDSMRKYNQYLVKVDNFYKDGVSFSDLLKDISTIHRPSGVYLTNISLENGKEKNSAKVSLSGFSNTRENLQTFKSTLENNQVTQLGNKIENVYFPPDVWIRSKDVNFSVSFEMTKNESSN